MPNWCSTTIEITHKDEGAVKELFDLINEWTSRNYMNNGFGEAWLGNIVGFSGIDEPRDDGDFSIKCRGVLTDIDYMGNKLLIYADTAWEPMLKMWVLIIYKYLQGAELLYTAQEPGCGLLATNNPSDINSYVLLSPQYDKWFIPKSDAVELMQKALGTDELNVDKLMEEFREKEDCYVMRCEYVPIEEWD